jgi:outer membrane lipoprotein-sorting protein
MRSKAIIWTTIVLVGVVGCLAIYFFGPAQQQQPSDITIEDETSSMTFEDEPEARALYEKMIETMRNAESLSYKSNHRAESNGEELDRCTYTIWMKKPNFFYVEAINEGDKNKGILIGDGRYAWNYWPNSRPWFRGEDNDVYEKSRFNVYRKEPAPPGKYAIGYAVVLRKSNCFPVLDPSIFQGIKNTLEPYIDWIRGMGTEKVGDEDCNVIEISYMNHKRSYYFWISKRDYLPRKLKDVVGANKDEALITHEVWSKVTLNAEIPAEKFAWTPPEGWQQWHPPSEEDKLLKSGQDAPDFELLSADGGKIKLSDFRGKVVWLYIWRSG